MKQQRLMCGCGTVNQQRLPACRAGISFLFSRWAGPCPRSLRVRSRARVDFSQGIRFLPAQTPRGLEDGMGPGLGPLHELLTWGRWLASSSRPPQGQRSVCDQPSCLMGGIGTSKGFHLQGRCETGSFFRPTGAIRRVASGEAAATFLSAYLG